MSRLIDADALSRIVKLAWETSDSEDFEKSVFIAIATAPTIEERKKGKWILCEEKAEESFWAGSRCSECNYWKPMGQWNYCPNCGADMREPMTIPEEIINSVIGYDD